MKGYVIATMDVQDVEAYQAYAKQVLPTIEAYGGRFLVRGGKFDVMEGEWPTSRIVVVEFPSPQKAREWYDSDLYRPLRDMRMSASTGRFVIVDGA